MNLQRHTEHHHDEESLVSEGVIKAIVIGALLGGVFALLSKLFIKLLPGSPVHPPIIIRSTQETDVPIEVETGEALVATPTGGATSGLATVDYTMKLGPITYVGIFGEKFGYPAIKEFGEPGDSRVEIWLQKFEFKEWNWLPDGPHFVIERTSTSPGFKLTCGELSASSTDLSNIDRPYTRYSAVRPWRIGKVKVGKVEVQTGDYIRVEVRISD